MAKNSIGQFIAALRKANGMTQQEVADRLNVSNKAVSRWERDECAPDLSVIPALAEMFGVTCDELLKGERIMESVTPEKKEQKVEKQIKALVSRTLSSFKTLTYIALALALIGLICMFGISYGFYRPIIGFAVMLLFEIAALVLTVLAVSKAKDVKTDNELFEMADGSQVSRFNNTLGNLSFLSFYTIFTAVLLSLPIVLLTSHYSTYYTNSVITFKSYLTGYFGWLMLILILVYLTCRKPYILWITGNKLNSTENDAIASLKTKLSFIQIGLTVLAGASFVITPYFATIPEEGTHTPLSYIMCYFFGIAMIIAGIIYCGIFLDKHKEERNKLKLTAVRNLLLFPAPFIAASMHTVGWVFHDKTGPYTKHDIWNMEYLWYSIAYCIIVFIIFALIDALKKKISKI